MNGSNATWRLQQQAAQLTRLLSDAGDSDDLLPEIGRLGRQLGAHAELCRQVVSIATELAAESADGIDRLGRLTDHAETTERMIVALHDDLRSVASTDTRAAAVATDLLDRLQELHQD